MSDSPGVHRHLEEDQIDELARMILDGSNEPASPIDVNSNLTLTRLWQVGVDPPRVLPGPSDSGLSTKIVMMPL